jgi:hypothetical protein
MNNREFGPEFGRNVSKPVPSLAKGGKTIKSQKKHAKFVRSMNGQIGTDFGHIYNTHKYIKIIMLCMYLSEFVHVSIALCTTRFSGVFMCVFVSLCVFPGVSCTRGHVFPESCQSAEHSNSSSMVAADHITAGNAKISHFPAFWRTLGRKSGVDRGTGQTFVRTPDFASV